MGRSGRTRYPHVFSKGAGPGWVNGGSRDPRWARMAFNAVAYVDDPVAGLKRVSTLDSDQSRLMATTPQEAAEVWLSRFSAVERAATARVIVWCCRPSASVANPYAGPTIVFECRAGRVIEIERRPRSVDP